MSRGYPSLFLPDSDDELSSDSGSEGEYQQSQPAHLPMNVCRNLHVANI